MSSSDTLILSHLWSCGEVHVPQLGVSGHLGGAGELVGAGAEEVASLHVAQRPAPGAVVGHTGQRDKPLH